MLKNVSIKSLFAVVGSVVALSSGFSAQASILGGDEPIILPCKVGQPCELPALPPEENSTCHDGEGDDEIGGVIKELKPTDDLPDQQCVENVRVIVVWHE